MIDGQTNEKEQGRFHNTLISLQLINEPNKLECLNYSLFLL
jgi:hypothetical protein